MLRLEMTIEGVVQGVGFRPFVCATARRRGLGGWVRNCAGAVELAVEGPEPAVRDFVAALATPPAAARIRRLTTRLVPVSGEREFLIRASELGCDRVVVPADRATCAECMEEVRSVGGPRSRYPFTTCAVCGPRFSIIESLPYDRARTTMSGYELCEGCARDYRDPDDRRFHAQAIACSRCGPVLRWCGAGGLELARAEAALAAAGAALADGAIVAVKGLGGYQLLCDAGSQRVVTRLRLGKQRGDKPFAVMFPSLRALRRECAVRAAEARALQSPEAPIVLVRRRPGAHGIAAAVAPETPWLGALLPYTPLHALLLASAGRALVCTSGNHSGEPLATDDGHALETLGTVADRFLVHDRAIVRPVDDSLARVGPRGLELLRRARGFAPLPLAVKAGPCVLALGGHLKSTVALAVGEAMVVSQHLGDLSSPAAVALHERTTHELLALHGARPAMVACDAHPDYASTALAERLALRLGVPLVRVQHHHAHVAAVMAEHGLSGPVLGLAWDGAGLGSDRTLWGGEALRVAGAGFERLARLRCFPLPGGERAMREPWRAALGLLHEIDGEDAWSRFPEASPPVRAALAAGVGCPRTSSMGRLFDGVAALAGLRRAAGYEGQAAVALELAADGVRGCGAYPLPLRVERALWEADWEPLIRAVVRDHERGVAAGTLAARFHAALVALAEAIAVRAGLPVVVLAGGCFQNRRLLRGIQARLTRAGFEVHAPLLYPANDGGLALGQAQVARASILEEGSDVSRGAR